MKLLPLAPVLALVLISAGCATPPDPSLAKVSRANAEAIALGQVPGGKTQSAELEREKGHLVWSFDISIPDSPNIREVLVDAGTGKIVSLETETPAQEAAEVAKEAKQPHR